MSNILINETPSLTPIDATSHVGKNPPRSILEARLHHIGKVEEKIRTIAAEVSQRKECIIFIKDLIGDLNNLMDDRNDPKFKLDVSGLKDQLKIAKEFGAKIDLDKTKYDATGGDHLIQNLQAAIEKLDMKNQTVSSEVHKLTQHYNHVMTLTIDTIKREDRTIHNCLSKIAR